MATKPNTDNLKGELRWRSFCAAGVAVGLHVVLFAAYAAFASINSFNPLVWLYHFISTIISPTTWLFWTPSALSMCLVGCSILNSVRGSHKIQRSRLDVISSYFSYQEAFKLFAYIVLAITVPVSYLCISGLRFTVACAENGKLHCLDSRTTFVASCSTWCGVVSIFTATKITGSYVRPLLINVVISDHIRPTLFKTMKNSALGCLRFLPIYMPIFYFGNYYINAPYSFMFGTFQQSNESFFNSWTILGCWVLASVTCTSILMIREVVHLYLTQYIELPVGELVALLGSQISPFEEQLIFNDLRQLALGRSVIPARDVFALSQPGGIPHNWNVILKNCLRVIYHFQNQITELQATPSSPNSTELASQGNKNAEVHACNLRRLRSVDAPPIPVPRQETFCDLFEPLSSQILSIVDRANLITARPLNFFTAPQHDLQICVLLENSQTVMLAASSLAGLSCRALKDDRFGVMVNDLPNIINTLVTLEESVGRIVQQKKRIKGLANTMSTALPTTLKQCITQIAHTYSTHLEFLRLEPARLSMLKRIVDPGLDKDHIKSTF